MPRRRDRTTRRVDRATRNLNARRVADGKAPMSNTQALNAYDAYGGIGQNRGAARKLGRRGVRARARAARMAQPTVSSNGNSPI